MTKGKSRRQGGMRHTGRFADTHLQRVSFGFPTVMVKEGTTVVEDSGLPIVSHPTSRCVDSSVFIHYGDIGHDICD